MLAQRPHRFLLGTRQYPQEWAHTILLSTTKVHGLGAKIRTAHLTNSRVVICPDGATSATWKCYRHASNDWDHLEFACEIPSDNPLQLSPRTHGLRIDFVSHKKYCVLKKHPVSSGSQTLACACDSSITAARAFQEACGKRKENPDLLHLLIENGFFEANVCALFKPLDKAESKEEDEKPTKKGGKKARNDGSDGDTGEEEKSPNQQRRTNAKSISEPDEESAPEKEQNNKPRRRRGKRKKKSNSAKASASSLKSAPRVRTTTNRRPKNR